MSDDTPSATPLSLLEAVFADFFRQSVNGSIPRAPHADVIPTLLIIVAGVDRVMREEATTRASDLSRRPVTRLHHKTVHDAARLINKLTSLEQIEITKAQRDLISSCILEAIEFKGGEVRLWAMYDDDMTPFVYDYPFVYPFPSGINNIYIDLWKWNCGTFQIDTLDVMDTVTGMLTSNEHTTVAFTDRAVGNAGP
tara:strand:- start:13336 stop:13923 length:588 start_codon:yes stop_codon:yes gene_type:complete